MGYKSNKAKGDNTKGFTLIELIVVMGLLTFVFSAATSMLVALMTQFKQQSKIAETNIEAIIGLEILRHDIQAAGHGLPTGRSTTPAIYNNVDWASLDGYTEASISEASGLNDTTPNVPPRAVSSESMIGGSDHLALKAVNYGLTAAAGKFHTLDFEDNKNIWNPELGNVWLDSNLEDDDYVIVLSMRDKENLGLVEKDGGVAGIFYTTFSDTVDFMPKKKEDVYVVYGISSDHKPRAPFNRADYFVDGDNVPARCAPGTGVLTKAVMSHDDGDYPVMMPLFDCVADFQVVFGLDNDKDNDTKVDVYASSIDHLDAAGIRDEVRQVRLFILAHEGQFDNGFTFVPDLTDASITEMTVGGDTGAGEIFKFENRIGTRWANYRWRVYEVNENPSILR